MEKATEGERDDWGLDDFERCVADTFDEMIASGLIASPTPYTNDFEALYYRVNKRFPRSRNEVWATLLEVRGHGAEEDDA